MLTTITMKINWLPVIAAGLPESQRMLAGIVWKRRCPAALLFNLRRAGTTASTIALTPKLPIQTSTHKEKGDCNNEYDNNRFHNYPINKPVAEPIW